MGLLIENDCKSLEILWIFLFQKCCQMMQSCSHRHYRVNYMYKLYVQYKTFIRKTLTILCIIAHLIICNSWSQNDWWFWNIHRNILCDITSIILFLRYVTTDEPTYNFDDSDYYYYIILYSSDIDMFFTSGLLTLLNVSDLIHLVAINLQEADRTKYLPKVTDRTNYDWPLFQTLRTIIEYLHYLAFLLAKGSFRWT